MPDGRRPGAAVVLAHPHPLMGGDMQLAGDLRAVPRRSRRPAWPCCGSTSGASGGSEGEHGDGVGERPTWSPPSTSWPSVLPASRWCSPAGRSAPTCRCSVDRRAAGRLVPGGPPAAHRSATPSADDPRPKLLAVPEHDQFRPPDAAEPVIAGWTNTEVEVVAGADHFWRAAPTRWPTCSSPSLPTAEPGVSRWARARGRAARSTRSATRRW